MEGYEFIIREKMGFFFVENDYIEFLKKFDLNVCDNYFENRAYIGIVIDVNDKKYLAPLTSAGKEYLKKGKYKRIVHPIEEGNLGFVRIGNMIPVTEQLICPIIIQDIEDEKYRNLLLDQFVELRKDTEIEAIRNKAKDLHDKRYYNDRYFLSDIMCNFKLNETKMLEFLSK